MNSQDLFQIKCTLETPNLPLKIAMTLRDRVAGILDNMSVQSQADIDIYNETVEVRNKLDDKIEEIKDQKENDYLASEWGLTL